ncbi:hypothetical protein V8E54_010160 [Elaphomyces granulatus]
MVLDRISQPYALLLLPPPPSPSVRALQETYGPALSHVFIDLCRVLNGANRIGILDVSLAIPGALSPEYRPRAKVFASLQRLLANFYTVVAAISAAEKIELDGPGGLDIRVFFVDYDPARETHSSVTSPVQGPIVTLPNLAASGRAWDYLYTLDTEAGRQLAVTFSGDLSAGNNALVPVETRVVPGGDLIGSLEDLVVPSDGDLMPHYSVVVGGTFDHLHVGHKLLLTATALAIDPLPDRETEEGALLTVGVTVDELLVRKKYAQFIESWEERWQSTAAFLTSVIDFTPPADRLTDLQRGSAPGLDGTWVLMRINPNLALKFAPLSDPFGPTVTDERLTALIISQETRSGGRAVNEERAKKGWPHLELFEVDVLPAGEVEPAAASSSQNFEAKISSTEIRRHRMELAKGIPL